MENADATAKPQEETPTEKAKKISQEIYLDWERLKPETQKIIERMVGRFDYIDEYKLIELVKNLIKIPFVAHLLIMHPNAEKDILQAIILSDVGKMGILEGTAGSKDQSDLIVEIFSISNIPNRETINLYDFVREKITNFKTAEERMKILELLRPYEVTEKTTLLEFHNLHTGFSMQTLKNEPEIDKEVRDSIARHHHLDGINIIGGELTFADKIVMCVDKFDAQRTRAHATARQAVEWIKNEKLKDTKYEKDNEFGIILDALEKIK